MITYITDHTPNYDVCVHVHTIHYIVVTGRVYVHVATYSTDVGEHASNESF